MKKLNLIGKRFGKLTVIDVALKRGEKIRWLCNCKCGNASIVSTTALRSGNTRSCGCLQKEFVTNLKYTHGMTGTKEYRAWKSMKSRCYNPNYLNYDCWGGRGIKVCDRWKNNFPNFLKDMGLCPNKFTLERKNNDGNYEPGNCEWASYSSQIKNKRRCRIIKNTETKEGT